MKTQIRENHSLSGKTIQLIQTLSQQCLKSFLMPNFQRLFTDKNNLNLFSQIVVNQVLTVLAIFVITLMITQHLFVEKILTLISFFKTINPSTLQEWACKLIKELVSTGCALPKLKETVLKTSHPTLFKDNKFKQWLWRVDFETSTQPVNNHRLC